ncbi:MAG: choice-of-anchor Q domain-containing protein [Luteolibacter sp.]|uniref:choice-of-anchor Q domain-containing protein n=1 Tax=Luteolibacter sp. TaxID=1962973 RepID=UPI003266752B
MKNFPIIRYLLFGWMACGLHTPVSASPIVNGSFESGLDGWTTTGNVSIQNSPPYAPTDGTKLAVFNAVNSTPNGSLSQTQVLPGGWNRLIFDVGNLSFNNQEQRMHVQVTELIAGIPYIKLSEDIVIPGNADGSTHWIHKEYIVTSAILPSTLTFTDTSLTSIATDLTLDNVRLIPSHLLLLQSPTDAPGGPGGVVYTSSPNSIDGKNGGYTQDALWYFEDTDITLSVLPVEYNRPFLEWLKDGQHYSFNRTIHVSLTQNTTMTAVHSPPLSVDPAEPFETKGFVKTGPYGPLYKGYTLANVSSAPVDWSASFQVTGGGSDGKWLSVWPPGGTLIAGNTVSLRAMVTGLALDLPAGKHEGRLVISTPAGNTEIHVSLAALDPNNLLANGSFESNLDGWTVTGNVSPQTGAPYVPTNGAKIAAFNAVNSLPNGVLSQTLPTEVGAHYSLDFDAGVLAYNTSEQRLKMEVRNVQDPPTTAVLSDTISIFGTGGGNNVWAPKHYEFVAQWPVTTLVFQDVSTSTANLDLMLDNVRISKPDFEIMVTTLADEDNPALGMGTGDSLREALAEAELRPGTNAILFDAGLNNGTITLAGGEQLSAKYANSDVAIDASGLTDGITVSGANSSRVFETSGTDSIRHLKIRNGDSNYGDGGAISTFGGGIYNHGSLMLRDCQVENNTGAPFGGGIMNAGALDIMDSTLANNYAPDSGGGLFNGGNANFTRSTVSGNSASANGGALCCTGGFGSAWITLTDSTVSNNTVGSYGGGYSGLFGYKAYGVLNARNTTFSGNTSTLAGGAIRGNGSVNLLGCTVSANSCTGPGGQGGGISSADLTFSNTIVGGNTAAIAPDVFNSALLFSEFNFTEADPLLLPLANYGGPTQTMKPRTNSPVLDAGGAPAGLPATDQRGQPRVSGTAPDIGAVEVQEIVVNTLVDENDGLNVGGISLRDAIGPASAPLPPELIRFAPALSGGTILLNGSALYIIGVTMAIDATNLPGGITISANHQSDVIDVFFSTAALNGLTITGITGSTGSGVALAMGFLDLTDCVIRNNSTAFNGAGLAVYDTSFSNANVTRCTFENNTAGGNGAAIHNEALVWVRDSTFSGNHAGGNGGAIKTGIYRTGMVIVNSTFSGNSSVGSGGAIEAGSLKLIHSTISGNSSSGGNGGGLSSTSTIPNPELGLSIANSIIAGNTAVAGPNINGPVDAFYGLNLTGGNPLLAPLDFYGSPTKTMPPLPGSPAIDGTTVFPSTPPFDFPAYSYAAYDQRGKARPNGPLPDIGAVEAFPFSSLPLVDSDHDGIDDRLEPAYQMTVGTNDSSRDTDGDGSRDGEEIANMTDPGNSNSLLKILSFEKSSGVPLVAGDPVFHVTFTSFPGLSYTLECDQNLDFSGPGCRVLPLGTAAGFTGSAEVELMAGHDFVRVRRDK